MVTGRPTSTLTLAVGLALATTWLSSGCQHDDGESFADDDDTSDDDDSAPPEDWVPSGAPELDWSSPLRVDAVHGSTPAILIHDDGSAQVFVHDADDPGGDAGALVVRDVDGETMALSAPVALEVDGFWPHVTVIDGQTHLLAATRSALHHLAADAGTSAFATVDTVANTDSSGCDGRAYDSRLAALADGSLLLGLGFVQHNAVFGCVNELHVARMDGDTWGEDESVASGWPTGIALWPDDQVVLASSAGVFLSEDGGDSFDEYVDGETTQDRVTGADTIQLADGTVLLVRSYNWASTDYLALVRGDPGTGTGTGTWTSPWVRLATADYGFEAARVARHGDTVVVVWMEGTEEIIDAYRRLEAFSRVSHDNGATWSEESQLSVSESGEQLRELALAAGDGHALAAYTLIRADGAREVYLVEAGW